MPSPSQAAIEKAETIRAKERDDRATNWHKVRTAQATPEQAEAVFADLRKLCLAGEDPAISAQFETNRTLHIIGRQSVWLEIQEILSHQPTPQYELRHL